MLHSRKNAKACIVNYFDRSIVPCQSGRAPLESRRAESCINFKKSIKSGNPLLPICEGLLVNNESKYNLRHQLQHKVVVNTNRFKDFVTFRYAHSMAAIGMKIKEKSLFK